MFIRFHYLPGGLFYNFNYPTKLSAGEASTRILFRFQIKLHKSLLLFLDIWVQFWLCFGCILCTFHWTFIVTVVLFKTCSSSIDYFEALRTSKLSIYNFDIIWILWIQDGYIECDKIWEHKHKLAFSLAILEQQWWTLKVKKLWVHIISSFHCF